MELIKAVHPLLWKVNQEQQKAVVPLNLQLSHQGHRFLIISGPVEENVDLYQKINKLIPKLSLQEDEDGDGDEEADE